MSTQRRRSSIQRLLKLLKRPDQKNGTSEPTESEKETSDKTSDFNALSHQTCVTVLRFIGCFLDLVTMCKVSSRWRSMVMNPHNPVSTCRHDHFALLTHKCEMHFLPCNHITHDNTQYITNNPCTISHIISIRNPTAIITLTHDPSLDSKTEFEHSHERSIQLIQSMLNMNVLSHDWTWSLMKDFSNVSKTVQNVSPFWQTRFLCGISIHDIPFITKDLFPFLNTICVHVYEFEASNEMLTNTFAIGKVNRMVVAALPHKNWTQFCTFVSHCVSLNEIHFEIRVLNTLFQHRRQLWVFPKNIVPSCVLPSCVKHMTISILKDDWTKFAVEFWEFFSFKNVEDTLDSLRIEMVMNAEDDFEALRGLKLLFKKLSLFKCLKKLSISLCVQYKFGCFHNQSSSGGMDLSLRDIEFECPVDMEFIKCSCYKPGFKKKRCLFEYLIQRGVIKNVGNLKMLERNEHERWDQQCGPRIYSCEC